MDEEAKRRLVGAAVLVALMVIFVPMLVDKKEESDLGEPIVIPDPPAFEDRFDPAVEPDPDEFSLPLPEPESPTRFPLAEESAGSPSAEDLRPGMRDTEASRAPVAPAESRPAPTRPAATGPAEIPAGVSAWVVQVASLTAPDAAQRLQNELRQDGYPAFIEQAKVSGMTYYRVRVGPEVDRARADRMATAIGAATGGSPLVQQYP